MPTRHTHKWDGLHTRHLLESTHTNTHKHTNKHTVHASYHGLRRSRPGPVIAEVATAVRVTQFNNRGPAATPGAGDRKKRSKNADVVAPRGRFSPPRGGPQTRRFSVSA